MTWQRAVYSLITYLAAPILWGRLLWRGRNNPAYRQAWSERLGFIEAQTQRPVIMLHMVSVGETMAARPLIEALLHTYPDYPLWLTSTTPTGAATVKRLFGERVTHSYLPYDWLGANARFLDRIPIKLLIILETELWPNLYAACAKRHIPLLLVNARLSERSVRRYQKTQNLVRETLSHISLIAARETQDAERFKVLGANAGQLIVTGNIKFDLQLAADTLQQVDSLKPLVSQRFVWVAASTHAGEDEQILAAHQQLLALNPQALLILVPRHPERFESVAKLCTEQGFKFRRRSLNERPDTQTQVWLADSMGELLLWYGLADSAFIGGSLVPVGGHNPLEAALWGIPVLSGTHIHNFMDIYPALVERGGAKLVESSRHLADHLMFWANAKLAREQAGQAAQQFVQQHQGVVLQLMQIIANFIPIKSS